MSLHQNSTIVLLSHTKLKLLSFTQTQTIVIKLHLMILVASPKYSQPKTLTNSRVSQKSNQMFSDHYC